MQRLLNGTGRITSALLEDDGEDLDKMSDGLQLPLPVHPPEVVCGGPDYASKVQFLLQLNLRTSTRRERESNDDVLSFH